MLWSTSTIFSSIFTIRLTIIMVVAAAHSLILSSGQHFCFVFFCFLNQTAFAYEEGLQKSLRDGLLRFYFYLKTTWSSCLHCLLVVPMPRALCDFIDSSFVLRWDVHLGSCHWPHPSPTPTTNKQEDTASIFWEIPTILT